MIIFHIEDNASALRDSIMDLLNQRGYSCSVSRVGQNSVVCAVPMQKDAPVQQMAPEEPVISTNGTLGSFEITDFSAQAIEIGKGISAAGDTLTAADVPSDVEVPPVPASLDLGLILNELSTFESIPCVRGEDSPLSYLYVQKIQPHESDPNQVLVTVKTDKIDCCVAMYVNEHVISQCSNEEPLRNREVDGVVVKMTSPLTDKGFGLILKCSAVDVDAGVHSFCCIGNDLSFLVDLMKE